MTLSYSQIEENYYDQKDDDLTNCTLQFTKGLDRLLSFILHRCNSTDLRVFAYDLYENALIM